MKKRITLIVFSVLIIVALYVLYCFNYIPHKKYTNADFNIEAYKSNIDKDNDGIDDQTDILNNANNYIKTNPKYKSKYYNTGYPDDEYGVCTDVVAFALKDAGYDLMVLVNEDIKNNKELYDIDAVDKNIDFRRVKNLKVYFDNNAISLTTDINETEEWQGGDIVVFKKHIGIISDKRNRKGICFVIHHANPYQIYYEEEILDSTEPVLIDFYADWCGPCQMLKPVIEQISEEAEHTKIVKINIDEEPQLAGMFQVMSIPTLVYMQNGSIQGSVSGYHSLEQIKSWIGE